MKRVVIHISLIIIAFVIYILQSNFFSWFHIAGVMPNLFIILALMIGLFGNKTMGTTYGLILGLILDMVIGTKLGIYAICLGLIGFLATIFDKNFSKNSRWTIMSMVVVATGIFEILSFTLNNAFISANIEIVNFIKILLIEMVFNVMITIIIYPLIQKFGYYIENDYKGNGILTRYF